MSVNTYIGAFALCQNEMVDTSRLHRTCKNDPRHTGKVLDESIQFCGKCGWEIGDIEFKESTMRVNVGDLFDEVQDMLAIIDNHWFDKDVDVWVNNSVHGHADVGQRFYASRADWAIMPEPNVADKAVNAYKTLHAKGLAKLIKAYGAKNVEIKWGILGWRS